MRNAWIEEVERLQRENNELRKENKKLQVTLEDLQDTVDKINAWREEHERRQQSISQL